MRVRSQLELRIERKSKNTIVAYKIVGLVENAKVNLDSGTSIFVVYKWTTLYYTEQEVHCNLSIKLILVPT